MPKYLLRLLCFTMILGALPVIVIGSVSYTIASRDIEQKVRESNLQILHQTQMRVEQVLRSLQLSSIQYVNSPLVLRAMKQPLDSSEFQEIRDLTSGFNNLQAVTSIDQAYLVNLDEDWVVSMRSFGKLSDFSIRDRIGTYLTYTNSLFWVTQNKSSAKESVPVSAGMGEALTEQAQPPTLISSDNVVSMVFKIPMVPTNVKPKGFLVIDIADAELSSFLSRNPNSGDLYVLDQDQQYFLNDTNYGSKYDQLNKNIQEKVQMSGESQGFFSAEVEDKPVAVSYRQSPFNGWLYVSVVSLGQITAQSQKIAVVTGVATLIMLCVTGLVAIYGSRRMYSPISRLLQFTKGLDSPLPPAGRRQDEFIYIEERLSTLFSSEQTMREQMKGQHVHLQEFFMTKLLTGKISEEDFRYQGELYDFPTGWSHLGVLMLQIDTLEGTRYEEKDRDLLLFAVNNMVGELLPSEIRFTPVMLDDAQVTVLASSLKDELQLKEWMHKQADWIRERVVTYLNLPVSIGISRAYSSIGATPRAYQESREALQGRVSLGSRIILHYEDIQPRGQMEAALYTQLRMIEDQLASALKQGDEEKTDMYFRQYLGLLADKKLHFSEYPVIMVQLLSRVYQLVQEQGGDVAEVLGEKASMAYLLKLSTLDEMTSWFRKRLFLPVIRFWREQEESQYMNIARRMIRLIEERYDRDLSLEACAEELNFHPVYLSRVFKKEAGVNFTEYLAEYRMEKAKTWLQTTDLKIAEIAEKLNYTNPTAFIRTFRKITGTTPGKYREQQR
ncbi:helix-turn-helix domain-containing protein [Paenibacillus silvae]|uniref:helix-turn-helix domain-containing protein n=1 Tax=Paenibacillus silvae TaxID=1325358 RepID=UPI002004EBEF|nr:helix-turn-helix domain-containing protein [Paenibacillus silvae]MCK6075013.1 helix-turn-helix domain-containing protein [Paenibacillus silvae]MCK6149400.1 helix-turn-helix domain-containing protein [Paenibacillus silvae]MCK6267699.1 helix-turn-helix domain-containing protein [Paenibacillus silvae]